MSSERYPARPALARGTKTSAGRGDRVPLILESPKDGEHRGRGAFPGCSIGRAGVGSRRATGSDGVRAGRDHSRSLPVEQFTLNDSDRTSDSRPETRDR